MARPTTYAVYAVLVCGLLYQNFFKHALYVMIGVSRPMQPLSDFGETYECRRVPDPDAKLQACEDMWLSEETRQLFLTCSDMVGRSQWLPAMHHYNASGRSTRDTIYALDIDRPDGSGSFAMRALPPIGFDGGELAGLSLTGSHDSRVVIKDADAKDAFGGMEILIVNSKPPFANAATGELAEMDPMRPGANFTIERFRLEGPGLADENGKIIGGGDVLSPYAERMVHVATHWDEEAMVTTNRVALYKGGFFFTNDHGTIRHLWLRRLSALFPWSDVHYCDTTVTPMSCRKVAEGIKGANGLVVGADGLVYVPSPPSGKIYVFEILEDDKGQVELQAVMELPLGVPIDNLSVDRKGDIYAAALPRMLEMFPHLQDPINNPTAPTTAFRLRRLADVDAEEGQEQGELKKRSGEKQHPKPQYEIIKVIEDRDAEVLPAATTVVHDETTGRVFLTGVMSPYIAVCEPKSS